MKKLILTVCKGNIHRSVVAAICLAQLLKEHGLESHYLIGSCGLQGSAGTPLPKGRAMRDFPLEWPLTAPVLYELGIEIPADQVATPVTKDLVDRATLILAMDTLVLHGLPHSLTAQFPDQLFKMRLFGEVLGTDSDTPDCGGSRDAELHAQVNHHIYSVLQSGFRDVLRLADTLNAQEN